MLVPVDLLVPLGLLQLVERQSGGHQGHDQDQLHQNSTPPRLLCLPPRRGKREW